MASSLPPGFTLDASPVAPATGELPAGFTLDAPLTAPAENLMGGNRARDLTEEQRALQRAGYRARLAGVGEQGPGVVGEGQGFSAPGPEGGLGEQVKGIAQGIPFAIPGALTGLPGLREVLPSHETMTSFAFGEPTSPANLSGRTSGPILAPVAGYAASGLTRLGEMANVANAANQAARIQAQWGPAAQQFAAPSTLAAAQAAALPVAARVAQAGSVALDPLSPLIGGAVNLGARGVTAAKNALIPEKIAPVAASDTTAALKKSAEQDYAVMDNSNLAISPKVLQSTLSDVNKTLEISRYLPEVHTQARDFLQILETRAQEPQSLTTLDALRGYARDMASETTGGEQKVFSTISKQLDDKLKNLDTTSVVPKDPSLPSAAPDTVRDALVNAQTKFGKAAKSAEIEKLINNAVYAPDQTNPLAALRTQFSSLAKNEDRLAQYSPAEQQVIKDIALGNIGSKTLQSLEKLIPGASKNYMNLGNLFTGGAGLVGGAVGGPIGFAAMAAPGMVGRMAENARAAQAMPIANRFAANIRAGNVAGTSSQPQFAIPAPVSPSGVRNWLSPAAMMYNSTNALANQ